MSNYIFIASILGMAVVAYLMGRSAGIEKSRNEALMKLKKDSERLKEVADEADRTIARNGSVDSMRKQGWLREQR